MYCRGEHMKCTRIFCNVARELKCTQMNTKHIQAVYMIRFWMLFMSHHCHPLCQNLLGVYELVQVQLHKLWLQIHGSFQKFCVWWQYHAVLHMTELVSRVWH